MHSDNLLWTTRDGCKLDPKSMTTSHIRNALAMLRRAGFVGSEEVARMLASPPPIGEFAEEAFYMECDMLEDCPTSPFIDIFESILKERENER